MVMTRHSFGALSIALLLGGAVGAVSRSTLPQAVPSVRVLIRQLESSNPQERGEAARLLRDVPPMQAKAAIPALLAILGDDADIKLPTDDFPDFTTPGEQAMAALGSLRGNAVRPLIAGFPRLNIHGQQRALRALVATQDPTAHRFVVDVMLGETRDMAVRATAALEVARLDHDRRAVPVLLRALATADVDVQIDAAQGLGELRETTAIGPLVRRLKAASRAGEVEQTTVIVALGKIGDRGALEPLLEALRTADLYMVRRAAAAALEGIADRAYPELVAALRDPVRLVGEKAAFTLSSTKDPAAIPHLAAVLSDPASDIGWAAAGALGTYGSPGWEAYLRVLHSSDARVRLRAAWVIGRLGIDGTAVVNVLAPIIEQDDSAAVRAAALGELPHVTSDLTRDVVAHAARDEDPGVRMKAFQWLLYQAGTARVTIHTVEPIAAFINDRDPKVRQTATRALAHMRSGRYETDDTIGDPHALWASWKAELLALEAFSQRTIHFTGTVLNSRGGPLADATVEPGELFQGHVIGACRIEDRPGCPAATGPDGRFDISLPGSVLWTGRPYSLRVWSRQDLCVLGPDRRPAVIPLQASDERVDFGILNAIRQRGDSCR